MTVAMVMMGLISLGLPLVGWWLGGRSMALRVLSRDQSSACAAAVRGCSLTDQQKANVRCAMTTGRRLDDPAERAAVVGWSRATITHERVRFTRHPVAYRALRIALLLWGAAIVVATVLVVAQARYAEIPAFPLAWYALFTALTVHHRATIRRALRNNTDVETPVLTSA